MCPFRCICVIPCVSGFWAYFCACLPLCVWGLAFCGGVSLCQSLREAPSRPSMKLMLVTLEHECIFGCRALRVLRGGEAQQLGRR